MTEHDLADPADLAAIVAGSPRPLLLALDVDGVLAPLVHDPERSALSEGVPEALVAADAADGVTVAVVSGRSLDGLATFGFPEHLIVVGGHGGEVRGESPQPLSDDERERHDRLAALAADAASAAGEGAWVEHKPASVVLHVRPAHPEHGPQAITELHRAAEGIAVKATPGSAVLELFARAASKGAAIGELRRRCSPATVVYAGDDVTDEEAFAVLESGDIGVKVGSGPTLATHRLADPAAVATWLTTLATTL